MKTLKTLALAAWLGAATSFVLRADDNAPPPPTISVSGSAEVRVPPDEVLITVGIENRHRTLDEAKNQNDTRIAALLRFLREAGIESKDIQTAHVGIRPEYQRDRPDVPDYYIVQRTVGIRLRKVADFEKVLTGSLKNGVNQVQGIDFRTTELRKHRDTARQLAIHAAREKAEDLAKELDVKIGRVQTIGENSWGGYGGMRSYSNFAQNTMQNAAAVGPVDEDDEDDLAVGQISISAEVQVTFRLVP
jgi:uncharacterized protein YggE